MNNNGKIGRAPGFEDRSGDELERFRFATHTLQSGFSSRGYLPIETPLIEQTELFLRMSGGLLSSQLFEFTSPDGSSISVRPELTSPVIRHALENRASIDLQRFQYAAPIVRYSERPYDAPPNLIPSRRQFTQVGAEMIGSDSPFADGEVIAMAYEGVRKLVDTPIVIRVGHVGLIWSALRKLGLSERAQLFLAGKVSELGKNETNWSQIESEAQDLGFLNNGAVADESGREGELLRRLVTGGLELPFQDDQTSRSVEDIVKRLKTKLDDPQNTRIFSDALKFVSKISQIAGRPEEALPHIVSVAEEFDVGDLDEIKNLELVVDAAYQEGICEEDLTIDIGMAADIAYYTGMIFDLSPNSIAGEGPWGAGGRYDRLAAALGSKGDIPALGFALNLDSILRSEDAVKIPLEMKDLVVVLPKEGVEEKTVARVAAKIRAQGSRTFTSFTTLSDAANTAHGARASKIVYVDAAGHMEIEER